MHVKYTVSYRIVVSSSSSSSPFYHVYGATVYTDVYTDH